ncbi:hypothetical protein OAL49_03590 [Gammaproteobacteria bacterium]|nr:hypothetical protein [Gammaproteobacteria bacterium]
MNPFFLVLITGILTLTSNSVLGDETDEQEARLEKSDHRVGQMGAKVENLAVHGPFVAAGASSGIEIATAVAIGVVGAALVSYGENEVKRGKSPTSKKPQDSFFASTGSNVRSTATTTSAGTSTTIGIATTVSTTSTTTASAGTSSASAVSSTGSM